MSYVQRKYEQIKKKKLCLKDIIKIFRFNIMLQINLLIFK